MKNHEYRPIQLFPTGATTGTPEGRKWLETQQTSVLVDKLWRGNYAFAEDADRAWVKDGFSEMGETSPMDQGRSFLWLPAAWVNEVFRTDFVQERVRTDELARRTGLYHFCDPRGFVLLSEKEGAVDTNTYGNWFLCYHDYFNVAAAMGTLHWREVTVTEQDYERYRRNWYAALTIPEGYEERFAPRLRTLADRVAHWRELLREYDFTDVPIESLDADVQKGEIVPLYRRLFDMAQYYAITGRKDGKLRQEILGTLEHFYEVSYSKLIPLKETTPAWTAYQFTIPQIYGNIMCLMYDDMDQDAILRHVNGILDRCPEPVVGRGGMVSEKIDSMMTYTNRLWVTQAFLNAAVLSRDELRINYGMRYLNEAFTPNYRNTCRELTMTPDGFYEDGSMVFHTSVAYNTGYGQTYAIMCVNYLLLSRDTAMDVRKVYNFKNVFTFADLAMTQFTADNITMKITCGRHMPSDAHKMLIHVMTIANYAPEEQRKRITAKLLRQIAGYEDTYRKSPNFVAGFTADGYSRAREVDEFLQYAQGMQPQEVPEDAVYNNMNKAVHDGTGFRAAIAMSSTRIRKSEAIVTDGLTDWFVNDGAVYVYTGDGRQYNEEWFNTYNPYRMPGTTVDARTREAVPETAGGDPRRTASNEYAGGASDGHCGVVAMKLGNRYMGGPEGNKSYFLFGDRIICLGSAIAGGEGEVVTVIDNRRVEEACRLYADGKEVEEYSGRPRTLSLGGKFGYVLLREGDVRMKKAGEFVETVISHGESPRDEAYAYVMLPNQEVSDCGEIRLLGLTPQVHAVYDAALEVTGIAFFESGEAAGVTALQPCVVLLTREGLFVCDPTSGRDELVLEYQGRRVEIDISRDRSKIYHQPWNGSAENG